MFWNFRKTTALVWLGLGLLAGLMVAGFWPSVPLHAVATDKVDTFSMATGPVDGESEAVYFFDHLTGDLYAYVLGRSSTGVVPLSRYFRNVAQDFDGNAEKAKYLMATGMADLVARMGRSGQVQPSRAVLYVAELTSGKAVAYYLPWDSMSHKAGKITTQQIMPVCNAFPIRRPVGAAAGGAAAGKGKKAAE